MRVMLRRKFTDSSFDIMTVDDSMRLEPKREAEYY